MKKIYIILAFITLLAAFLRLYQLGFNPPSLTWDEVAWGYNAYSLGIDGHDEFGRFIPINYLESFGDFKPPMYAYLDILPVKIFGLNEFAVRFPSAIFGVLTILITYFLVKEIFGYNTKESKGDVSSKKNIKIEIISLSSALFLAVSPWHIMLSRAAFEANIATFFLVVGVWLFLVGLGKKPWCLSLSVTSFVLSLYTFNSARVVGPLLLSFLLLINYKLLLNRKKHILIAGIIGLLLILPIAKFLFSPQAGLRFKEVNIFSDGSVIKTSNQAISNDGNSWLSKMLHNRRLAYGVSFLNHYFDNLTPNFLFISGDGNPKFSTQDVGQMYIWDLVFLIVGLLLIFKKREGYWWIIPLWLILGIIPAATARETPHALRIEATLPTFQILAAYGFGSFIAYIKRYRYLIISSLSLLLFVSIAYFLHGYYMHYAREFSGEWQYGYKDSISFVQSVKDNYDEVDIVDALGRPYIYYLFYTKTLSQSYRQTAIVSRDVFGFVDIKGFDKYRFKSTIKKNVNKKTLYIDLASKIPLGAKILKTFYLLNGKPTLVAYEL